MRNPLLVAIMAASVLVLVGSSPAHAQGSLCKVTVPFQFVVGETVLPAGSYVVMTVAEHPEVMWLQNAQGKTIASVLVQRTGELSQKANAQLSFQKYGGQYFLSEVSIPGTDGRALSLPKRQVESVLARLNGTKAGARARPSLR